MIALRRIVAPLALLCLVWLFSALMPQAAHAAPCTAPCTKAQITTDIGTNWPDNTIGAITPALLRSTVLEAIGSYIDANGGTSLSCAAHNWVSAIPTLSSITCTQPAIADVSGWGTGVATALGVAANTAGGPVVPSGALTLDGVVYGGGSGASPGSTAAGTNGQLFLGVTSGAPQWGTMSGDATITNAGALTVAANAITNAKMAAMAAWTFKVNDTSGSATPTDQTIDAQTLKASPAAGDEVWLWDVAGAALKKTTVSGISGAGAVSSIDTKTGAFTTGNGLDSTGGNLIELTAARRTLPTTVSCVSGLTCDGASHAMALPTNALWGELWEWGAGGGGGGGGSGGGTGAAGGATCWNTSGSACSSPVYQAGGGAAAGSSGAAGGAGGTLSGSSTCSGGGSGGTGSGLGAGGATQTGGIGGAAFGIGIVGFGAAPNNNSPSAPASNSGGGGGGGTTSVSLIGNGGGGGAECYAIITTAGTYQVGTGGTAGAGGTSGAAGAAGANGNMLVVWHYGT